MSGRAGRRGKDDRGIVIQMLDEKMDPQVAKGTSPCTLHNINILMDIFLLKVLGSCTLWHFRGSHFDTSSVHYLQNGPAFL